MNQRMFILFMEHLLQLLIKASVGPINRGIRTLVFFARISNIGQLPGLQSHHVIPKDLTEKQETA